MKLRLLVLGCVLFSFTSCFDIIETFTIKENGGGIYQIKTDMSKAITMLAMMGGGKSFEQLPEKIDTTIALKGFADTASTLTAAEKAAISKLTASVFIDKNKGELYMQMNAPFDNAKEYELIHATMKKLGDQPMNSTFNQIFGDKMGKNPMAAGGEKDKKDGGSLLPSSKFETSFTDGNLRRWVKPETVSDTAKMASDDMPEDLKEMFRVNYTTIVNVPRPVKKITGAEGKLSDDKKQVKFSKRIDLSAGLLPADFDFSIEY